MAGLSDALEAVLGRFRGLEVDGVHVRAVADPNDVVPPCVFVPLPDVVFQFSKRRAELTWTAYLVGPTAPNATGTAASLARLVDTVTGLYPFREGDVYTLTLPGGGPPAQSYRLTWLQAIQIGVADG